jgi:hypothetical protein
MKINKGRVEEYKRKSAIKNFFNWIKSCKKVFPRYEIMDS